MDSYGALQRKRDFDYFVENYQYLFQKYGHKFLAIKNKTILGSYDTELDAIKETSKTFPLGTFIVQECNGNESGYTNYISSWQIISV